MNTIMDHHNVHASHAHGATLEVAPCEPGVAIAINVDDTFGALVVYGTNEQAGLEVHLRRCSEPTRDIHVWMLPRILPTGSETVAAVFGSLEHDTYDILSPDGSVSHSVEVQANNVLSSTW